MTFNLRMFFFSTSLIFISIAGMITGGVGAILNSFPLVMIGVGSWYFPLLLLMSMLCICPARFETWLSTEDRRMERTDVISTSKANTDAYRRMEDSEDVKINIYPSGKPLIATQHVGMPPVDIEGYDAYELHQHTQDIVDAWNSV